MAKERPILMQGPLVVQTLAGVKTCTRRGSGLKEINKHPADWEYGNRVAEVHNMYADIDGLWGVFWNKSTGVPKYIKCPYGKVGDVLWVRETFVYRSKHDKYYYKADNAARGGEPYAHTGWKPSIHMPRKACRLRLEITGIEIQRLQDISEEDCLAEGIEVFEDGTYRNYFKTKGLRPIDGVECWLPIGSFQSLICSINGHEIWDKNEWVWVIRYKIAEPSVLIVEADVINGQTVLIAQQG